MQKIKMDNGCKYLKISEVYFEEQDGCKVLCYEYYCKFNDRILNFGIFNCHKCKNYLRRDDKCYGE